MRFFQLKNDTMRRGLPIIGNDGPPRLKLSEDGQLTMPLGKPLAEFYKTESRTWGPPYVAILDYATLGRDMKTLHLSVKPDRFALLHIVTYAGEGGDVSLTACAFDDIMHLERGDEVVSLFRPFPPAGVEVLNTYEESPWFGGAQSLEVAVLMYPNSSFKICRTGKLEDTRHTVYVRWDGYRMMDSPNKEKRKQFKSSTPEPVVEMSN